MEMFFNRENHKKHEKTHVLTCQKLSCNYSFVFFAPFVVKYFKCGSPDNWTEIKPAAGYNSYAKRWQQTLKRGSTKLKDEMTTKINGESRKNQDYCAPHTLHKMASHTIQS
jgi:hypothetical protein